jgi:hypothetical protein
MRETARAVEAQLCPNSTWPGSIRPPIAIASASARRHLWRADARRMGWGLEAAHDGVGDVGARSEPGHDVHE